MSTNNKTKLRIFALAIIALGVLSLPVAGQQVSLKMEKQFSGNRRVVVAWEPHSLVPGFGLDQLRITASYALERSQDLILWEPTGQTYEGGLHLPDELLRFEADSDVRSSYYRVVQTGIDLEGAVFSDQSLVGANLAGANLQGANFSFADLSGADLRGANLSGTNLTGADLRSARLDSAILTGTILDGANLIGVSLEDVQIDGVDLSGALELPSIDFGGELVDFISPLAGGQGVPQRLGFSVGGANDINNFRRNIDEEFLPLVTDVTYEGLFYDYFFETGQSEPCEDLFCPSYSFAVSADPLTRVVEPYLSVGLNSGIAEVDFSRKKLNLVIVLDVSGSMSSSFSEYYYDQFGNQQQLDQEDRQMTKMEVANQAVVALLSHLEPDDNLSIVLFSSNAQIAHPMSRVSDTDMEALEQKVLAFNAGGGTNMSSGMQLGSLLLKESLEVDHSEFENRIIFLTDAQPNLGELSEEGLLGITQRNAENQTYATLIGIGLDFNTELVESILKTRGANYYSVHSPDQFVERMDEGFEFMVTPLVFNLKVTLSGSHYSIQEVYGSPEASQATGEVMKVATLFPSRTVEGETRGGLVLLKLKRNLEASTEPMRLTVQYEDRSGEIHRTEAEVNLPDVEAEFFANTGIRKGILLSRYAQLIQTWIADERASYGEDEPVVQPSPEPRDGNDPWWWFPPDPGEFQLGEWERQSIPLFISRPYRKLFGNFLIHFESEMQELGDDTLSQEVEVLQRLSALMVAEDQ